MTSQSATSKTKAWLGRVVKSKGAYGMVDGKEEFDETSYELVRLLSVSTHSPDGDESSQAGG
ncbi:MAG: hypothetical protein Q9160_002826 [Pyrenula sp. 1 TL-2023]